MLLRHDARRHPRDDLLDIALSLPFQTEANTGFGVLAKVYLDALIYMNNHQRVTDPNAEGVKEMKETALDLCVDSFDCCKYPRQEVERGFRFWDVVSASVRACVSLLLTSAVVLDRDAPTALGVERAPGGDRSVRGGGGVAGAHAPMSGGRTREAATTISFAATRSIITAT